MTAGEADLLAALRVSDDHVALEFSRADADEGNAVTMPRVHVRLDLEHEAGEPGRLRIDDFSVRLTRARLGGVREETVEEHLHAEIVDRAAEKDRRELAVEN